jgi:Tol biopolymer transport system component/DNA-binding winged helix-turn-helix (wHTH) protein
MSRRGLFRGQDRVHLTGKPLETLILLVENRGRTVGKHELLDRVWKDTFVTEDVLTHAIGEIRRTLHDDKNNPRFIQTIPREGYRFVGDASVELPFTRSEAAGPTLAVVKIPPSRKSATLPVSVGLTVVILLTSAVWYFWRGSGNIAGGEFRNADLVSPIAPAGLHHILTGEYPVGKPSFSPDGKLILYVGSSRETEGYGDIFVMPPSGETFTRITERVSPSGDLPVFTADSRSVVFSKPRGGSEQSRVLDLYIASVSGGESRLYLPEASGAGFSPDGKWIAYTKYLPSRRSLWLSATNDLSQHVEIAANGYTPRWSPDGRWLAFTTSDPNGGTGDLWVEDFVLRSEPRNLTRQLQQLYGLTWATDNRRIVFSSKRTGLHLLWSIAIDDGKIDPIITNIGESAAPTLSPDGRTLVFHSASVTKDLMLADRLNSSAVRQVTHDEYHQWLRLSPSGDKSVSVVQRPDFGDRLYITDLRSLVSVRLSDGRAHHPCWLDDDNVAYLSDDGEDVTKVQTVNLETRTTSTLTTFPAHAEWLAVLPGTRSVAAVLTRPSGGQSIVVRDLDGGIDKVVIEGGQYAALRWAPDGSALLWSGPNQASSPTADGIWSFNMATGRVEQVVSDGYGPVWSPDGDGFLYSRNREFSGLWKYNIRQRRSAKIRDWGEVPSFDVVGERLLYTVGAGYGKLYSMSLP